jgi:hypothetical protein
MKFTRVCSIVGPETIVRELLQGVMNATALVNKQLDDLVGDAETCATSDITAQVFCYARLIEDDDLCCSILGVGSDELVFSTSSCVRLVTLLNHRLAVDEMKL